MKNLANYISISRMVLSVVLIKTKVFSVLFYLIYCYCGLSDILDGHIARKNKKETKEGAMIDSIADIIFVLVSILKTLPALNLSKRIIIWIVAITVIKFCNIILGCIYHKRLVLPHTIPNKITGILVFIIPFVHVKILYIIVLTIATFSAIYEGYYIKNTNIMEDFFTI